MSQRSLAFGEVSPTYYPRADLALYAQALRTCRNATVLSSGGVASRPGTLYVGSTKSDGVARLIPFVRASAQEYLIEMGTGYLRFWLDDAAVTVGTPSAWSASSVSYTAGTSVSHSGTNYICILSHTSGAGNEPGTGGGAEEWYALTSNILELPTPYQLADLAAVQWADDSTRARFFAHPSYPMRELIRISATAWTFLAATFDAADDLDAPENLTVTASSGLDAEFTRYQVTAVAGTEESLPSNIDGWNKRPGPSDSGNQAPLTLAWDAVAGAEKYNVYISLSDSAFYFRAQVTTNGWVDDTTTSIDKLKGDHTPPSTDLALTDFTVSGSYPGVLGVHQQRLIVSGQTDAPDVMYASRTANFNNFYPHVPIQDDDALEWRMVASRLNRIRYVAEVDERLVVFSETAEGVVRGDTDGILRPGEVNPRTFSHHGIAQLPPIETDTALVYVQHKGRKVRGLSPESGGVDLSLTAEHLLRRYTIEDWCYQPTPHPTIWMVRSDGVLLSLTYQRETGVVGWARHDTDGPYESVTCLGLPDEDAVYAVVKRTINSSTKRYVERFADRMAAWPDTVCMDAAITLTPMSGFETWTEAAAVIASDAAAGVPRPTGVAATVPLTRLDEDDATAAHYIIDASIDAATGENITLEFFARADERSVLSVAIKSAFVNLELTTGTIGDSDAVSETFPEAPTVVDAGNGWWRIRMVVESVSGIPGVAIQLSDGVGYPGVGAYNGTAGNGLYLLGGILAGLDHLEGELVSVVADGVVVASPNNSAYEEVTVTDGAIAVPAAAGATSVLVGLPFTVDVETLDIRKRAKDGVKIGPVTLHLEESFTPYVGTEPTRDSASLTGLQPMPMVDEDDNTTTDPITGYREVRVDGAWTEHGRTFLRHIDPTPLTVTAILPDAVGGR